jgi:hypothetical protein
MSVWPDSESNIFLIEEESQMCGFFFCARYEERETFRVWGAEYYYAPGEARRLKR